MKFKIDLSKYKELFEEKRKMMEEGKPYVFPKDNLALIYWDGKDEEIMLKLYKSQLKLIHGILEEYLQLRHIRKSEIMYSGQLKDFNQLKYKNKSLDKQIIDSDNQKIFEAIKQLGGDMESYFMVSKFYTADPKLEKISFEEAKKLVDKGEAEFKKYKNWDLLSYNDELYWKYENKEGVYFQ